MEFGGKIVSKQTGSTYNVVGSFWDTIIAVRSIGTNRNRVRIQSEDLVAMSPTLESFGDWSKIKGGDHISVVCEDMEVLPRVMQATLALAFICPPAAFVEELFSDDEAEEDEGNDVDTDDSDDDNYEYDNGDDSNTEDDDVEPEDDGQNDECDCAICQKNKPNNLATVNVAGEFISPTTKSVYKKVNNGDTFVAYRHDGDVIRIRFQAPKEKLTTFLKNTANSWGIGQTGTDHVSFSTTNEEEAVALIEEALVSAYCK